jgi:RecB family exonuclease
LQQQAQNPYVNPSQQNTYAQQARAQVAAAREAESRLKKIEKIISQIEAQNQNTATQ